MFCKKCGFNNKDGAKFCQKCGHPLNDLRDINKSAQNNDNSSKNNNYLIIACIIIIAIVLLGSAAFVFSSNNQNNNLDGNNMVGNDSSITNSSKTSSSETNPSNANSSENNSIENNSENTQEVAAQKSNQLKITSGTITIGSSSSDKAYCSVFVGTEHAGEKVQMSTLYSNDGSNLNPGKLVSITVDNSGYASVWSANALEQYPDQVIITICDNNGNRLDSKTVSLDGSSGTHSF